MLALMAAADITAKVATAVTSTQDPKFRLDPFLLLALWFPDSKTINLKPPPRLPLANPRTWKTTKTLETLGNMATKTFTTRRPCWSIQTCKTCPRINFTPIGNRVPTAFSSREICKVSRMRLFRITITTPRDFLKLTERKNQLENLGSMGVNCQLPLILWNITIRKKPLIFWSSKILSNRQFITLMNIKLADILGNHHGLRIEKRTTQVTETLGHRSYP